MLVVFNEALPGISIQVAASKSSERVTQAFTRAAHTGVTSFHHQFNVEKHLATLWSVVPPWWRVKNMQDTSPQCELFVFSGNYGCKSKQRESRALFAGWGFKACFRFYLGSSGKTRKVKRAESSLAVSSNVRVMEASNDKCLCHQINSFLPGTRSIDGGKVNAGVGKYVNELEHLHKNVNISQKK